MTDPTPVKPPPRRQRTWLRISQGLWQRGGHWISIATLIVWHVMGPSPIPPEIAVEAEPTAVMPGWLQLGACRETSSLDGSRTLDLFSDGRATLTEGDATIDGQWTFENETYRLSFPRSQRLYIQQVAEGVSCMLLVGTLESADLRLSFFGAAGP
jgi:hypothetical protein